MPGVPCFRAPGTLPDPIPAAPQHTRGGPLSRAAASAVPGPASSGPARNSPAWARDRERGDPLVPAGPGSRAPFVRRQPAGGRAADGQAVPRGRRVPAARGGPQCRKVRGEVQHGAHEDHHGPSDAGGHVSKAAGHGAGSPGSGTAGLPGCLVVSGSRGTRARGRETARRPAAPRRRRRGRRLACRCRARAFLPRPGRAGRGLCRRAGSCGFSLLPARQRPGAGRPGAHLRLCPAGPGTCLHRDRR